MYAGSFAERLRIACLTNALFGTASKIGVTVPLVVTSNLQEGEELSC